MEGGNENSAVDSSLEEDEVAIMRGGMRRVVNVLHRESDEEGNENEKEKEKKEKENYRPNIQPTQEELDWLEKSTPFRYVRNSNGVLEVVGSGGFACVYRCQKKEEGWKDNQEDTEYAVKVMKRQRIKSGEGRILQRISLFSQNLNLSLMKDDEEFNSDTCTFIVMSLLKGKSLTEDIYPRTLEEMDYECEANYPAAAFLLNDLGLTLAKLHSINVIHRDIKPQNVIYHLVEPSTNTSAIASASGTNLSAIMDPTSPTDEPLIYSYSWIDFGLAETMSVLSNNTVGYIGLSNEGTRNYMVWYGMI